MKKIKNNKATEITPLSQQSHNHRPLDQMSMALKKKKGKLPLDFWTISPVETNF